VRHFLAEAIDINIVVACAVHLRESHHLLTDRPKQPNEGTGEL
jgi:hypothetical protein